MTLALSAILAVALAWQTRRLSRTKRRRAWAKRRLDAALQESFDLAQEPMRRASDRWAVDVREAERN